MTTSTFAQTSPTRPGLADVGGGDKVGSTTVADPRRALLPDEANQLAFQAVAAGAVLPVAVISVSWSGSAYAITKLVSANPNLTVASVGGGLLAAPFRNGAGDVTIAWSTGVFPTPVADAVAHVTGTAPLLVACESLTTGGRVRMKSDAGAATDSSFVLTVY